MLVEAVAYSASCQLAVLIHNVFMAMHFTSFAFITMASQHNPPL